MPPSFGGQPPMDPTGILIEEAPFLCEMLCDNQTQCQDIGPECFPQCMELAFASLSYPDCPFLTLDFLNCMSGVDCKAAQFECAPIMEELSDCMGGQLPPIGIPVDPEEFVVCKSGSVSGGTAQPDGGAPSSAGCDATWMDCSDGRTYRSTCIDGRGTGNLACSCIVDGRVQGSFFDAYCPLNTRQVDQGCGWQLVQ